MTNLIEIINLNVKVGDKLILEGLNLKIKKGEVHVIFGQNGCGKSTLLAAIMGLPGYKITKGKILLNGKRIDHKKTDYISNLGVGLAFVVEGVSENIISLIVAFAAGNFLYIAGSDLVPELHKTPDTKRSLVQLTSIFIGIALMFILLLIE